MRQQMLEGVDRVIPVLKPYKLASREYSAVNTAIPFGDPAGTIVGGREIVVNRAPSGAVAARSSLQDHGRLPHSAAVEIELAAADVDAFAVGYIRRREAVAGEPGGRAADADDVDRDSERETGQDREGDRGRAGYSTATAPNRGIHAPYRTADSMYPAAMCRSIKTLRRADTAATTGELEAAARQFVRKISGYRTPSARNADAFEAAIAEVAHTAGHLLEAFGVPVEQGPDRWTPSAAKRSLSRAEASSTAG